MKLSTLEDLFVHELRDVYNAENQLIKAMPKMAKAAASEELRAAFEEHLEQTKGQVERLDRIFSMLDASARGKRCKAMEGLIEEGKDIMSEDADPGVTDGALIAAAQKVEHYEIAAYGTLRTWAQVLGHHKAAKLLQETLDEEGETDKRLSHLAESIVNPQAV